MPWRAHIIHQCSLDFCCNRDDTLLFVSVDTADFSVSTDPVLMSGGHLAKCVDTVRTTELISISQSCLTPLNERRTDESVINVICCF